MATGFVYTNPKAIKLTTNWWREKDSNLRRHMPTDLQSAPFDRFGISPRQRSLP